MQQLTPNTILHGHSYNYIIDSALGQGSFGITYLAKVQMLGALGALDSNMKVAIKEFFMRDINGREGTTVTFGSQGGVFSDYRKKFAREAENLARLKHPNIVKVLESFEENNTIYYVMEYIDGGSLDGYIKQKGKLGEGEAINLACQIGSALSFMHSNHMLHLDMKPANVMRMHNGQMKLIDFGLSKNYDAAGEPESSTSVGGGTPGYAPLEQSNFHNAHDFPVTMDVYAFGATIYKMLTGQKPPIASDILNEGFPTEVLSQCGLSIGIIAIVKKAMAPIKKDRYQRVDDVIDALKELNGYVPSDTPAEDESEDTISFSEPKQPEVKPVEKPAEKPVEQPKPTDGDDGKSLKWVKFVIATFVGIIVAGIIISVVSKRSDGYEYYDEYADSIADWDSMAVDTVADFAAADSAIAIGVFTDADAQHYDGSSNGHEWVDLGLPSHKKWATCNIGASSPTATGDYYGWGEVKTRNSYTEDNDFYFSLEPLTAAHDVATKLWGKGWKMPTKEDVQELFNSCYIQYTDEGVIFIGGTGHKMFLPFTGSKYGTEVSYDLDKACYWTATPDVDDRPDAAAFTITLYYGNVELNTLAPFEGLNIRAVH